MKRIDSVKQIDFNTITKDTVFVLPKGVLVEVVKEGNGRFSVTVTNALHDVKNFVNASFNGISRTVDEFTTIVTTTNKTLLEYWVDESSLYD